MPRKQHKYHYIYKTTCIINGKFYIGMHSTSNLDDGYMGSGKRLKRSLKKYGIENHIKEILEFLNDRKILAEREEEIVNEQLLEDNLCMNLKTGGTGGFINEEHKNNWILAGSKAGNEKLKNLWENDNEWKQKQLEVRKSYRENPELKKRMEKGLGFHGRNHKEETKEKISQSRKGKGVSFNNSQYGTCWITNGKENKKINKGDLIPEGWKLGRKIK